MALKDLSYDDLLDFVEHDLRIMRHEGQLERLSAFNSMQQVAKIISDRLLNPDAYDDAKSGQGDRLAGEFANE